MTCRRRGGSATNATGGVRRCWGNHWQRGAVGGRRKAMSAANLIGQNTLPLERARAFCAKYQMTVPILMAPMASACPASLAITVANAGGMGAMGALMTKPAGIRAWVNEFRAGSNGPFQLNLWIPEPQPVRDPVAEQSARAFLAKGGPEVPTTGGDAPLPDFREQCEAFLKAKPTAVSSIMGLYPPEFVTRLKENG